MMLIVSLLVLLLSLFSTLPELLAHRTPNSPKQTSNSDHEVPVLTVQMDSYSSSHRPIADSPKALRAKMSYLSTLLNNHELYGSWQASNLKDQQGYTTLRMIDTYKSYEESFDMALCLYNGLYVRSNYTCISFSEYVPFIPVSSFNEQNMTLNFSQITVHVAQGADNQINHLGKECTINCLIYLTDRTTNTPFVSQYDLDSDKNNFEAQFQIQSTDCGIAIDAITTPMTSDDELITNQALNYSVGMTVMALFQCGLCYFLNKLFDQNKRLCQRISQGTLKILNAFDLFIALQSFFRFTTSTLVGLTTLPYLVLALYFEPKVIRTIANAQGDLKQRGFKGLSLFNFTLLLVSAIIAAISAFCHHPEWMIFIFSLHQFPQIFQNYQTQRKFRLKEWLVFAFVIPKLAYISYLLVFPQNLFRETPNLELAIIFANVLILQILLLAVQKHYPMLCTKRKVVYQSFLPSEKKSKEEVCSVCLENLETTTCSESNDSLLKGRSIEDMKMILTPCQHEFHECCLRDWTKLKSVCPYCRFSLPPLPDEEED